MKHGARVHVPVSIAETRISKRYDAIPSGTLYPNADEIKYLQRLVIYKACLASKTNFILFHAILLPFLLFNCMGIHSTYCILCSMYCFQDSAIILLNKPPKLPVKVWISILSHFQKFTEFEFTLGFWFLADGLVRGICQSIIAWMHWQLQHCPMIMMRVLNL